MITSNAFNGNGNEIKPNNEIFTYKNKNKTQIQIQIHSELICSRTLMTSSWLPDFSTNTELIMSLSKFGNIFPISNNCSSVGNLGCAASIICCVGTARRGCRLQKTEVTRA